jgi:hypothetical protein
VRYSYYSSVHYYNPSFNQRATASGFVLSGFGLSAFLFSGAARTFFPGDTSALLTLLALGTSIPILFGFFVVRPIPPSTKQVVDQERPQTEGEAADDSETTPLLKHSSAERDVSGWNLLMQGDFWLFFSIMSLRAFFITFSSVQTLTSVSVSGTALMCNISFDRFYLLHSLTFICMQTSTT